MHNHEMAQVEITIFTGITCDKCKATYDDCNVIEMNGFVSVKFSGGYGSIFEDGGIYQVDLCQQCVKEVLGPYLRQPDIGTGLLQF